MGSVRMTQRTKSLETRMGRTKTDCSAQLSLEGHGGVLGVGWGRPDVGQEDEVVQTVAKM